MVEFSSQIWSSRLTKSRKLSYFWIRFVGRFDRFLDSALDDNDYALRENGGKHQNDYKLHEDICITDFQSS